MNATGKKSFFFTTLWMITRPFLADRETKSMCLLTCLCPCTVIPQVYNRTVAKGSCHIMSVLLWTIFMFDVWWFVYAPYYDEFIHQVNTSDRFNETRVDHQMVYVNFCYFAVITTFIFLVTIVHSVFTVRRIWGHRKKISLSPHSDLAASVFCPCLVAAQHLRYENVTHRDYVFLSWDGTLDDA